MLLDEVASTLDRRNVGFAMIGASALAVHGVSRSTLDQDLLVTDATVLNADCWSGLSATVRVDIRRGDIDDPLAGVVRCSSAGERDVDIVVGRYAWQTEVIQRATPIPFPGRTIPVATAADVILLKLYAGGAQDRWDIEQLLAVGSRTAVAAEVEQRLPLLPPGARRIWQALSTSD